MKGSAERSSLRGEVCRVTLTPAVTVWVTWCSGAESTLESATPAQMVFPTIRHSVDGLPVRRLFFWRAGSFGVFGDERSSRVMRQNDR